MHRMTKTGRKLHLVASRTGKQDDPAASPSNRRLSLEERLDILALTLDELEGRMNYIERLARKLAGLVAMLGRKVKP